MSMKRVGTAADPSGWAAVSEFVPERVGLCGPDRDEAGSLHRDSGGDEVVGSPVTSRLCDE